MSRITGVTKFEIESREGEPEGINVTIIARRASEGAWMFHLREPDADDLPADVAKGLANWLFDRKDRIVQKEYERRAEVEAAGRKMSGQQ